MTFDVAAESYDRFMGRYAVVLAPAFAEFAGVGDGQRVLDVGCGPGALTAELVARVGAANVAAVDPSEPFVAAARERQPGVDVSEAAAEELPFGDGEFDAALAQLVVHFMRDAARGIAEMARVTRGDGVVAACVWDIAGDRAPLSPFWRGACELDPSALGEAQLFGTRAGEVRKLLVDAGLGDVHETELEVSVVHESFEEWWEPFTLGVGPAGAYLQKLGETEREEVRERCRRHMPDGSFTFTTYAWAARVRV